MGIVVTGAGILTIVIFWSNSYVFDHSPVLARSGNLSLLRKLNLGVAVFGVLATLAGLLLLLVGD